MVYQVGNPAMFEGNMFLPETGTPIWKILRNRTVFELCEPEPSPVATWILMSLTIRLRPSCPPPSWGTTSVVAIPAPSLSCRAQARAPLLFSLGTAQHPFLWRPAQAAVA